MKKDQYCIFLEIFIERYLQFFKVREIVKVDKQNTDEGRKSRIFRDRQRSQNSC